MSLIVQFCLKVCVCDLNRESLGVVKQYFPQYALHDQDILGRKESVDKILALVPEDILFCLPIMALINPLI